MILNGGGKYLPYRQKSFEGYSSHSANTVFLTLGALPPSIR